MNVYPSFYGFLAIVWEEKHDIITKYLFPSPLILIY